MINYNVNSKRNFSSEWHMAQNSDSCLSMCSAALSSRNEWKIKMLSSHSRSGSLEAFFCQKSSTDSQLCDRVLNTGG